MDQQQRGDFVAFMNRDKQPGDRRPAFEGRISKPGSDDSHPLTLWAHEYTEPKSGEVKVMLSGFADAVATSAPAADQVAALIAGTAKGGAEASLGTLTLAPRQVVLFPNGFRAEAPDKNRPDYWGAYNPGDGSPVVRSSVWLKTDRNGRAYLSGATSYPIPGQSERDMQAADQGLQELVNSGAVSKGMPEKRKGRSGRE